MDKFEKRCKALRQCLEVYVGYDDYERIYKYVKGNVVEFKGADGTTGTLDYNRSEDAKEALFHGWDITREDYENGIYRKPDNR